GFDRDTVSITLMTPPLQPDLGPDINLCPGEEAVLSVNIPGASYVWNDLSTADTLLVDTAGTYFVQVANACGELSDTIIISGSGDPPSLNLASDFELCQGDTAVIDAGISGVSYLWNDGTQNAQLSISDPGQYALTVTNSCGVDSDTIVIGDGGPAPSVALGPDTSLCNGTSITITPGASNVFTWSWQDGSTFPIFTATTAGEVHVTVSNSCGYDSDTMQIGLLPAIPALSLGPDTSLCPGASLTLTIGIPGVDILWMDGTTDTDFTVMDSVTVIASITNSCGVSTDSISVSILDDIPALDLGPDQSLCPGELITLNPGVMGVTYLWQDGSNGSTMNVMQAETITLVITNDCGTASDTIEIYESTQGPQVDLGPDVVACAGETVVIETNISGVNYEWQDGSVEESFTATASGTYYVQVSNLCGSDSDTIEVEISGAAPIVDLGADTILCEGTTLLLTYPADAITSVMWQDGSDEQDFSVQSAGVYTLTATNRCGSDNDSIQIGYIDAPDPFYLGPDTVLCAGESILLLAPVTSNEILWQDGSANPQLVVSDAGTYVLAISNACGQQTDSITVVRDDVIPTVYLGVDTVLCAGDHIELDATQSTPAHYLWNTGEETPILTVITPGIYAVSIITPCESTSDEIEILAKTNCIPESISTGIYIPNIFSPNDDQVNDIFFVGFGSDIHLVSMEGSIFDRWGNMVYRSEDIPFTWDGKRNETWMQPGVYVYSIRLSYEVDGREINEVFTGDVTLMR
ncbi:MAG: gliding motility-associated C-terminal domain-containing protein, partial [Saprospiraceae bacterium]|nr:gliding motility-associated C-terminal domain-containing protein [Saprospiraceae bacterium]